MTVTRELLLRWHQGDQEALASLVQQDANWIEQHVRKRLGPLLRKRTDTQDIVQNTLLEVLRCGPRFIVSDRAHLRALLAKMVENALHVQARRDHAGRRDVRREAPAVVPGESGSVLILDQKTATVTSPGGAAEKNETRAWVRLALELLDPDDRNVVLWREYENLPFADIAERLGVAEDAARMRFTRALPKLAQRLRQLKQGQLEAALGDA